MRHYLVAGLAPLALVLSTGCSERKRSQVQRDSASASPRSAVTVPTAGHAGDTGFAVTLPPAMQAVLSRELPGFVPWQWRDYDPVVRVRYQTRPGDSLFAVFGDFNGDGEGDVVVSGHDGARVTMVALLSRDSTFLLSRVTSGRLAPDDSVGAPRTITLRIGNPGVAVDAVVVEHYIDGYQDGRPQIYFWDGTRFLQWGEGE